MQIIHHGDTMVPVWSAATYDDHPLTAAVGTVEEAVRNELFEETKRAGWKIRETGEHSCYAISFSAVRIIEALLDGSKSPLLVSSTAEDIYRAKDAFVSIPSLLGKEGIVARYMPELNDTETAQFAHSVATVRTMMNEVDTMLG